MSPIYRIQTVCKNPDCKTTAGKQPLINVSLGPVPTDLESATRQIQETDWAKPMYVSCERCGRTYSYSASDLFVSKTDGEKALNIDSGRKKPDNPDRF